MESFPPLLPVLPVPPDYFCELLVGFFAGVASTGLTAGGTVSVRLYFASDVLTADAFAMTAFRSAIAFGVWVWQYFGPEKGEQFFTGYLIEKTLSLDNVFVMSLIFAYVGVPRAFQHRVTQPVSRFERPRAHRDHAMPVDVEAQRAGRAVRLARAGRGGIRRLRDEQDAARLAHRERPERLQLDGDRIEEDDLDVEQDEQHRDQVEADPEPETALDLRRQPALVRRRLGPVGMARPQVQVEHRERRSDQTTEE